MTQMEALASNGYIVIAPDHTYGAVATRFPDGEVVYHDPEALPDAGSVTVAEREKAEETLVEVFAEDLITILDELDLGVDGRFANFANAADLTKLGVFGHSAGGGGAIWVCLVDDRCDAVLGFDPWIEPLPDRILRIEAAKPALFMRSEEWRGTQNDAMLRGLAARGSSITYWMSVDGTDHNDFTIAPLLTSWGSRFGFTGTIGAGGCCRSSTTTSLGSSTCSCWARGPHRSTRSPTRPSRSRRSSPGHESGRCWVFPVTD